MTNEALAVAIQAGRRDLLPQLWAQVYRLAWKRAARVHAALGSDRLADMDDLMQGAFLGLLDAVERFDPAAGLKLTTYLGPALKNEFAEATSFRTARQQRDPMRRAASLDAPIDPWGDPDGDTLGDTIATRQDQMAAVDEADFNRWRQETVRAALDRLPEEERETIYRRYFDGLSLQETAQREGVEAQEIRRRQERAFRTLRRSLGRFVELRTDYFRGGFNPVLANTIRREELATAWANLNS